MITQEHINAWFTYHPPQNESEKEKYEKLRNGAKAFAEIILATTPPSADQTAAIRKVREAVMTANAAIACDGRLPGDLGWEKKAGEPPAELTIQFEQILDEIIVRSLWKGEFVHGHRMAKADMLIYDDAKKMLAGFVDTTRSGLLAHGQVITNEQVWTAVIRAAADMEKKVRRNPLK